MKYLDPIERFLQSGLRVIPQSPDYIIRLEKRFKSDRRPSHISYVTIMGAADWVPEPPRRHHLGITISWMCDLHQWMMASVEGHGALNETDFFWAVPNFDIVTDLVLKYYFGQPDIMHGWRVSLHQHPELQYKDVEIALAQATYITPTAFQAVVRQLADKAQEQYLDDGWQRALASHFLPLTHVDDTQKRCMLLRNGTCAYILINEV